MANTLTNFLVGIGWETSNFDKGTRDIERSISGVKVTTLAVAGAILGVFGAVASSATANAKRIDQLALATQNLNTGKQFVDNLGGAIRLMGGDAADALKEVRSIESAISNFTVSKVGPLLDLATAGVDISKLSESKTAEGFLSILSEQVPTMSNAQKQLTQQALELSDATMKAMGKGAQQFDMLIHHVQDLTGGIDGLTDESRILREKMAEFGLRMDGVTNELTEKTLPSLIGITTWFNKFIDEHRSDISGTIDVVAEHPAATAALGAGAAAASIGAVASKIGLTTLGSTLGKTGQVGMIVGGAALAADATSRALDKYLPGYSEKSKQFDAFLEKMLGIGQIQTPSQIMFGGASETPTATPVPTFNGTSETPTATPVPTAVSPNNIDRIVGGAAPATDATDRILNKYLPGYSEKSKQFDAFLEKTLGIGQIQTPTATPVPTFNGTSETPTATPVPTAVSPNNIDRSEVPPIPKLTDQSQYTPESLPTPYQEVIPRSTQDNDLIVKAIQAAKVNVANHVKVNVTIDGQALDSRITEVTERDNYSTIDDVRSSTAR